MSVTQTGKMGNASNLASLTARITTPGDLYLGFATVAIGDTSTLATITESTSIARFQMDDKLGTAGLNGSGVPEITNDSDIVSGNATASGEALIAWFITTVPSASTGDIIAYGNGDAMYTNIGSAITITAGDLKIQID